MNHLIKINKRTGQLQWLTPPPIQITQATRPVSKQRYSEIVPVSFPLFLAFRFLRLCFGEVGRVSEFTRRWPCLWHLEVLQGPAKGVTQRSRERQALLDLEREVWHTGIEKVL